ncbi:hypothetical protein M408DRAFT_29297 [Serendipita vermifera MAFF 305830]|uniref:Retrotransposon gag domain-containing protein n=1 Tax=Serendipita vermifera MAFF 305830 TaxID=933852 RepID=A0A0C3ANV5_SERVB|nr:hypothetical protein M408DRAFT_29297 [Serendipita vermifera MAFF 305830]
MDPRSAYNRGLLVKGRQVSHYFNRRISSILKEKKLAEEFEVFHEMACIFFETQNAISWRRLDFESDEEEIFSKELTLIDAAVTPRVHSVTATGRFVKNVDVTLDFIDQKEALETASAAHILTIIQSQQPFKNQSIKTDVAVRDLKGTKPWIEAIYEGTWARIALEFIFKSIIKHLKWMAANEPRITSNPWLIRQPLTGANTIPVRRDTESPPSPMESFQSYPYEGTPPPPPPPPKGPTYRTGKTPGEDPEEPPKIIIGSRAGSRKPNLHTEENKYIFTDPPGAGDKEVKKTSAIIDNKIKVNDLPSFSGRNDEVADWVLTVNDIANRSRQVWQDLGATLPGQFTSKAHNWWQALPNEAKKRHSEDWETLRLAVCKHWMTVKWKDDQKISAEQIRFRDHDHPKEWPTDYYYRKLRALRIARPTLSESTLIQEILDSGRREWFKYLRPQELTNLESFSDALQENETFLIKEIRDTDRLDKLWDRSRPTNNSGGDDRNRSDRRPHPKVHLVEPRKFNNPGIGAHKRFDNPPNPREDRAIKKGKTPKEVGGRACRHCNGDHWDYQCTHNNRKTAVKVNFLDAEPDLLQAIDEYQDLQAEAIASEDDEELENSDASE